MAKKGWVGEAMRQGPEERLNVEKDWRAEATMESLGKDGGSVAEDDRGVEMDLVVEGSGVVMGRWAVA